MKTFFIKDTTLGQSFISKCSQFGSRDLDNLRRAVCAMEIDLSFLSFLSFDLDTKNRLCHGYFVANLHMR